MRNRLFAAVALAAGVVSICARPAAAQEYESIGIRAQGMGGAFVALADDATATWWNPAGLASGAYLDSMVEYGVLQQPEDIRDIDGNVRPAVENRARGIAFAFPAMGLSYYRLQLNEIRPLTPIAQPPVDREDQGTAGVRMRSVVLNQFGATVGQSLSNHLVIASTVRLVRASVATGVAASSDVSYDLVSEMEGDSEMHTDLDVGALAIFGHLRMGVAVKNVREPEFGPDNDREELERRARVGVALSGHPGGGFDQVTLAFDADLTTASFGQSETKNLAAGVEAWLLGRRLGVRAGVSANQVRPLGQELRLRPSGGLSIAVKTGTYLEAQYTAGPDKSRKGWGFDMRVTF